MSDKKLPEINISDGQIVADALQLVQVRAAKAQLETKEKELKVAIENQATTVRDAKLEAGEVIGLIRITNENLVPVQVQFRVDSKKAALSMSDEGTLNDLFEGARPLLFGKDVMVTEITDPEALIAAMKASGRNPWDFLHVSVREGSDQIVSGYVQAVTNEAFMPKEGFLTTIKDIWHTLSVEAIEYLKTYFKIAIKPMVIVGSKGNGNK